MKNVFEDLIERSKAIRATFTKGTRIHDFFNELIPLMEQFDSPAGIKPLEFKFDQDDFSEIYAANPMHGVWYNVKQTHHGWAWRYNKEFYRDVETEQEAKAACLTDWLERIGRAIC